MKRLLLIEFQKTWKNKAARVLTITYFALLSSLALMASINFEFIGINIRLADQGIFNFPYIWHFNTWMADWFKLFFAIVVVSMVSNEYSYGTLKQNLIDGMSKKEFLLSKVLLATVIALLSTLFVFVMSLILGLFFSSYNEMDIILTNLEYLLAYFIKHVAFFMFCIFLAIWIKRSAFALGFLFLWLILESMLLYMILPIYFGKTIAQDIMAFFPLEAMSNILIEPISKFQVVQAVQNQTNALAISKDYDVHWYRILLVVIWTVFFFITSFKLLKKRDL